MKPASVPPLLQELAVSWEKGSRCSNDSTGMERNDLHNVWSQNESGKQLFYLLSVDMGLFLYWQCAELP